MAREIMARIEWTQLLGTTSWESANALTTGLDGSIYVAGGTRGDLHGQINSGGGDAFITKYNPDGTKAWTSLLGSRGGQVANALTTGLDGSIFVAGSTSSDLDGQTITNSGWSDAFISKYNPDGTRAWTRLLGTTSSDTAHALTTGLDGSIYVAGSTHGNLDGQTNSGGADAFITKYNPDGTRAWTRLLGTSGWDWAIDLTTGLDGSIYVAGRADGDLHGQTNSGGSDAFISKYNPDGTRAWTRLLGTWTSDDARALTTGLDGSIYVAGYTSGNLDGQRQINSQGWVRDAFISKYNPDGTRAWTRLLEASNQESAFALTTGLDGSIYVAGETNGNLDGQTNSGGVDAFITKYNPDGTKAWTRLLGTSGRDVANALTTGLDGSIFVAGSTEGDLDGQPNSGGTDAFIVKLIDEEITTLSIAPTNAVQPEGNTGTTPFTFTVTRTGNTTGTSSANWAVTGTGDNPANAADFGGTLPSGIVTFAAGVTSQVITVNVQGDTVVEPDETFTVTLSGATNATITTATATGTILNDDTPPVERDRQQITSLDNLTTTPGGNVSIPLFYNTSTGDNTVTGISMRLHYNSNELTFQNVDNFFSNGQFVDLENLADTRDFDNNPETDRYIQFGYADFAGNWPNQPLPLKLGDFNFTTSRNFEGTQLNVTSDNLAPGYSLESDSIFVGKQAWNLDIDQAWNLDIDGDGRADALSDGIMIIRYLFGTFPGERLINGAISHNATRNLAEIEAYLQKGVDNKYLDIDGDGQINALSDGIMVVRHMFGTFPDEKLIEGAISPDATRDLGQIQAHLTQFSTI